MYASWSGSTSRPRSPAGWPSSYAAAMKSFWTPDSESSAGSSMAVLPRSVSTSRQPARESVLAMRSAGKCGSMGKYAPSSEAMELETQLLGGEQGLSRVFGNRIGRDQRQRGAVVAGDPGGALRVQHVRLVAQPQHEPFTLHEGDAQHGVLGELPTAVRTEFENGLERQLAEA